MTDHSLRLVHPEVELLLCCGRVEATQLTTSRIRQLLEGVLDWPRLYDLAERHGMRPLLAHHLLGLPDLLPIDERRRLRRLALANGGRILGLTRELMAILRLLKEASVPAVPYKGPVMAAQLYGHLALREAGDLDLVVRKKDVDRARKLLFARGYAHRHALTPANSAFRLSRRYCENYVGPDGVHVDLHWRFTNPDLPFPLTLKELMPRLRTQEVAGEQALTFSREDLLLILCAHGAKHRWDRLEWIVGVSELLRAHHLLDWRETQNRAAELGATRMLQLGVFLAYDFLGAPLPDQGLLPDAKSRWVSGLASDVRNRLDVGPARTRDVTDTFSHNLFQLPLQDRAWDQLRYVLYRMTTPNQPDRWQAYSVCGRSIPLHALTWPLRLGGKLVRRHCGFAPSNEGGPVEGEVA